MGNRPLENDYRFCQMTNILASSLEFPTNTVISQLMVVNLTATVTLELHPVCLQADSSLQAFRNLRDTGHLAHCTVISVLGKV